MADILELKKTLKKWEVSFLRKYDRRPSKSDIDAAPQEIKDAYKNYATFKKDHSKAEKDTSILQDRNDSEKKNTSHSGAETCSPEDKPLDKEKIEIKTAQILSPKQDLDEIWGSSLNKTKEDKNDKNAPSLAKPAFSFLDKLGDKLFQNSKKMLNKKPTSSWGWKSSKETTTDSSEGNKGKDESFDDDEPSTPFQDVQYSDDKMDETDGAPLDKPDKLSDSIFSPRGKTSKFSAVPKFSSIKPVGPLTSAACLEVPNHLKLNSRKKFSVSEFKPKEIKNPFPEDESDSNFKENTGFVQNVKSRNDYMEIDDSFFEQEFAENIQPIQSKPPISHNFSSPKPISNTRIPSFHEEFAASEPNKTSTISETKSTNKSTTIDRAYSVDNDSDASDDEVTSKSSRKRKKGSGTTAKKRLKVDDGVELAVGGDSVQDDEDIVRKPKPKPPPRRPVASKGPNENFVRLNMKVKKYRRKDGRHMTGGQWKRKQWKDKMQAHSKSFGDKCFICNETGHWSRNCPQKNGGKKKVERDIDENDFPTLMEAAGLARGVKMNPSAPSGQTEKAAVTMATGTAAGTGEVSSQPAVDVEMDVERSIVRSRREQFVPPTPLEPLVNLQPNGELAETSSISEIAQGLKVFGFKQFRQGQEETIKRILSGLSTLVVLSTGGGKSLCYQLPAYTYAQHTRCITLVVSPLVSLMEDQVTGLPAGVRGACLHANMTKAQRDGVLAGVNDGNVHFLLVSPEAVVGGGGGLQGSFPAPDKLPPIAFVCIDEAHCLSEWSHNFRPSYLRLCKVLRERYGVKCFLGLTATATKATALDVARHLGIEDVEKATIRGSPVPRNLILSVSQDENRDEALVELLRGERFKDCHSIIVYATRRELTNRVATFLRTSLQEEADLNQPFEQPKGKAKKKKKIALAESYHAGLTPAQRKRVQKNFMSGQLRIVVATVAFGMGLDKADVRAVIHYNMPKSFEGYVQEIGRAGRDGKPSHCHLFLDPEGRDLSELKRHTYGNTVDRIAIKKLLAQVFKKCRCREIQQARSDDDDQPPKEESIGQRICPGHERALSISRTVTDLDIREEGISTLLCYLEVHPHLCLENLQPVYANCKIICYGGPPQLQQVAKKCPPVGVAIARQKMKGKSFSQANTLEFPIVDISDTMGWDSGPVKREVKLLQWNMSAEGGFTSKSGVLVEFSELAFHLRAPGDLSETEMDDIVDFLHRRVTQQEKTELFQLNLLYTSLRSAAHKSYWMCSDEADLKKSDRLRGLMENFFHEEKSAQDRMEEEAAEVDAKQIPSARDLDQVIMDVRSFVNMYGEEHCLNGRAIARIFHGIGSPCFPVETWCRVRRFWRSHLHMDFNVVLKTATRELVRMR